MNTFCRIRYFRKSPAEYHDYAHDILIGTKHSILLLHLDSSWILSFPVNGRHVSSSYLMEGSTHGRARRSASAVVVGGLLGLFGTFAWVEKVG